MTGPLGRLADLLVVGVATLVVVLLITSRVPPPSAGPFSLAQQVQVQDALGPVRWVQDYHAAETCERPAGQRVGDVWRHLSDGTSWPTFRRCWR